MKTTSLLLLCCLLCLAVFTKAHSNKNGGKPKKPGRGHSSSDSSSDSNSYSRSNERHHKKCQRLRALTWKELGYLQTYDKTEWAVKPIALGEATFKHNPNGEIEATCKCEPTNIPGYNTVCQLKFNNGYDTFYSQNATTLSVNGNEMNGQFELVKTKGVLKIKCDKRKGQIRVNGKALTHYTCFSAVFKNDCKAPPTSSGTKGSCKKMCPQLRSLSWEELVKYSNTWANLPYKLQPIAMGETSFKSTPKGIEMTCRCQPVKGKNNYCALEFDNGFDSYWTKNATAINKNNKKNGDFKVIESKDFVTIKCDSSTGNILVNGTALTNYVCYSAHFYNDCTLPPTGNVAKCTKRRYNSNSYSNSGSSCSSESHGSYSNSDQSD